MSPQAWTVAILYGILVIIGLITSIVQKKFSAYSMIGILFTILFLALIVYDTHCLTAGGCTVWSWIRTAFYIIFPVIFLIIYVFAIIFGKKIEESKEQKNLTMTSTKTVSSPSPTPTPSPPAPTPAPVTQPAK